MNSVKTNDILGHKEKNIPNSKMRTGFILRPHAIKAKIKNIHLKKTKKNTPSIEILKILTHIIVV